MTLALARAEISTFWSDRRAWRSAIFVGILWIVVGTRPPNMLGWPDHVLTLLTEGILPGLGVLLAQAVRGRPIPGPVYYRAPPMPMLPISPSQRALQTALVAAILVAVGIAGFTALHEMVPHIVPALRPADSLRALLVMLPGALYGAVWRPGSRGLRRPLAVMLAPMPLALLGVFHTLLGAAVWAVAGSAATLKWSGDVTTPRSSRRIGPFRGALSAPARSPRRALLAAVLEDRRMWAFLGIANLAMLGLVIPLAWVSLVPKSMIALFVETCAALAVLAAQPLVGFGTPAGGSGPVLARLPIAPRTAWRLVMEVTLVETLISLGVMAGVAELALWLARAGDIHLDLSAAPLTLAVPLLYRAGHDVSALTRSAWTRTLSLVLAFVTTLVLMNTAARSVIHPGTQVLPIALAVVAVVVLVLALVHHDVGR